LAKDLGHSKGYLYSHDYPQNFVEQEFMPVELSSRRFWKPTDNTKEHQLNEIQKHFWKDKYGA